MLEKHGQHAASPTPRTGNAFQSNQITLPSQMVPKFAVEYEKYLKFQASQDASLGNSTCWLHVCRSMKSHSPVILSQWKDEMHFSKVSVNTTSD